MDKEKWILDEIRLAYDFMTHCINYITSHMNFLILVLSFYGISIFTALIKKETISLDVYILLGILGIFLGVISFFIFRMLIRELIQVSDQRKRMEKMREYLKEKLWNDEEEKIENVILYFPKMQESNLDSWCYQITSKSRKYIVILILSLFFSSGISFLIRGIHPLSATKIYYLMGIIFLASILICLIYYDNKSRYFK